MIDWAGFVRWIGEGLDRDYLRHWGHALNVDDLLQRVQAEAGRILNSLA